MRNLPIRDLTISLLAASLTLGLVAIGEDWEKLDSSYFITYFNPASVMAVADGTQVQTKKVPLPGKDFGSWQGQPITWQLETTWVDCIHQMLRSVGWEAYGPPGLLHRQALAHDANNENIRLRDALPGDQKLFRRVCDPDQKTHALAGARPPIDPAQAESALLSMDYSTVAAGQDFQVNLLAISHLDRVRAYVYLVPSAMPHGNEKLAHDQYLTYHNVGAMEATGASQGRFVFDAPSTQGFYDLRLFDGGKEISSLTFRAGHSNVRNLNQGTLSQSAGVTKPVLHPVAAAPVHHPPPAVAGAVPKPAASHVAASPPAEAQGKALLKLNQRSIAAGNDFSVYIATQGLSLGSNDYIYLVPSRLSHGNETLAESHYSTYHSLVDMEVLNSSEARLTFDAPDAPGSYDLRLFHQSQELFSLTFRVP